MAELRKDNTPPSQREIEQMYLILGLDRALSIQRIAGNETGDRQLPKVEINQADQRRERRTILNVQNT